MPKPNWKVFYGDGSTATDLEFTPFSVRGDNIQYILQRVDNRVEDLRGDTYYCWHAESDRWLIHDVAGFWQYMLKPGAKRVLFGMEIAWEDWNRIQIAAQNDPDFH